VARELAGAGADVLVLDRYEIGERATSACAAPTRWLQAMGAEASIRQEIPCMRFTTPRGSIRCRLPWSWSAFDYNGHRPHRGLGLVPPRPRPVLRLAPQTPFHVRRRDRLGGLIHEYSAAA
jgi:hypothetical protein